MTKTQYAAAAAAALILPGGFIFVPLVWLWRRLASYSKRRSFHHG
jgi:hypothetical protein